MSKVRSAITAALVVIAIIVAAVFGVASFNAGVAQRYNAIAAEIPLGSDYTGYVYTTIYPEGVISASDYNALEESDKSAYERHGGVYVSLEDSDYDDLAALTADVESDAAVLSERFADRGLSDYSVSVRDGLSIVAAVPSGFTYAAYKGNNSTDRSSALSAAANTLGYLLADGELTIRTVDSSITLGDSDDAGTYDTTRFADEYTDADILGDGSPTYPFVGAGESAADYFSSVSAYTFGGSNVLSFSLTQYGRERMRYISSIAAYSESQVIYVCVGDTQVLAITCTSTIDSDKMQFSMNTLSAAEDAAAVLGSVINGGELSVAYRPLVSALSSSAAGGENAALLTFVAFVVVLAALCVAAVVRYKKLGGVLSLSLIILALVMLYALYILSILTTFAVVAVCAVMLVLFAGSNVFLLNEVRAQCKTGKTMQAAVKSAYKRTWLPVLDIHAVILAASIIVAAVCIGEAAACGLIAVVGSIASIALWWFTRLMWHVCSAPVRNKFAFGGFKREVYGDD